MNTYELTYGNDYVKINNINGFNLPSTFDNGQCFRWEKISDNAYLGIAFNKVLEVFREGNDLVFKNTNIDEFKRVWYNYFTLDIDYTEIKKVLKKDPYLKKAIDFAPGLRLLRQDFFETLISFIISANNNIKRIKKIINNICTAKGTPIEYQNTEYMKFPQISQLRELTVEEFKSFGAGYRSPYLVETINSICNQKPDLNFLRKCSLQDARKYMINYKGVGVKVADCILLYSGTRYDVFPTDVWVKRIMGSYLSDDCSVNQVLEYAMKTFGEYAGFAQQYLFHYARFNM